MSIFTKYPLIRWVVPAGITLAVVGGGAASALVSASADPTLPERSAAQLLVDLQRAEVTGLSGTVVERADLGLPALPTVANAGSTDLASLLTGSHTLRVWLAAPDKMRFALLGSLGETDVILNDRDLWIWDSQEKSTSHQVLPGPARMGLTRDGKLALPSAAQADPLSIAEQVLAAIDPATVVTTAGTARVADRPAYELVLAPRDTESLISQIRIAIDADRRVPLRVQVYGDGSDTPGFECAFTQVSFDRPDDAQFRFNPPEGTTVREGGDTGADAADSSASTVPGTAPTVIGSGWTSVLVMRANQGLPLPSATENHGQSDEMARFLSELPEASGDWGTGWLISGKLFSALVTTDGRVLVGAVSADRLQSAAAELAKTPEGTK